MTPALACALSLLRLAHDVADAGGEYRAAFLIAVVVESLTDGTEAELAEALTAVACGPVAPGLSPKGAAMVAGLTDLCDTIEAGIPLEDRFTVRTVRRDRGPDETSEKGDFER